MKHNKPQNKPTDGTKSVLPMVVADLTERALDGLKKYGNPLQTNNGRNSLWDAYQEALDLCMYLRQKIEEEEEEPENTQRYDEFEVLESELPHFLNEKLLKLLNERNATYQYCTAIEILVDAKGLYLVVNKSTSLLGEYEFTIMYMGEFNIFEGAGDNELLTYNKAIEKAIEMITKNEKKTKNERKDCNNGYGQSC